MSEITLFTKDNVIALNNEIKQAIFAITKAHGIDVKFGNIRYAENKCKFNNIEFFITEKNVVTKTKIRKFDNSSYFKLTQMLNVIKYKSSYYDTLLNNLNGHILDAIFENDTGYMFISDFNTRKYKYPLTVSIVNKKSNIEVLKYRYSLNLFIHNALSGKIGWRQIDPNDIEFRKKVKLLQDI